MDYFQHWMRSRKMSKLEELENRIQRLELKNIGWAAILKKIIKQVNKSASHINKFIDSVADHVHEIDAHKEPIIKASTRRRGK